MTITRKYSLPNCTLLLEGLSSHEGNNDTKAILAVLFNAECQIQGSPKLSGGRVFLENLVNVVSAYAQEFLSGVRHPQVVNKESDLIQLEKISGKHLHCLTWRKSANSDEKIEIPLTTVHLFDLVEAVDQFLGDSKTLPEMTLNLQPVSRSHRQAEESLIERSVPATVGLTSVAAAALALFLMPAPEVVRQPETKPQETPTQTIPNNSSPPPPSQNPQQ